MMNTWCVELSTWYSNGLHDDNDDDDCVKLFWVLLNTFTQSVWKTLNWIKLLLSLVFTTKIRNFLCVFTFMELNCYIYCIIYRWISMFMNRARFMVLSLFAFIVKNFPFAIFHDKQLFVFIRFNHLQCPYSLSFFIVLFILSEWVSHFF